MDHSGGRQPAATMVDGSLTAHCCCAPPGKKVTIIPDTKRANAGRERHVKRYCVTAFVSASRIIPLAYSLFFARILQQLYIAYTTTTPI